MQTLRGEDSPTLLSLLDTCRTGMGSRALRQLAAAPAARRARRRAAPRRASRRCIDAGIEPLREALRGVSDVERITARIALRQVRPRELVGLRATLQALPALRAHAAGAARRAARRAGAEPAARRRQIAALLRAPSPTSPPRCCATAA